MFRPQFFFQTPKGYRDDPYSRFVPGGQDPVFTLAPGQYAWSYPVKLDNDAPSILRSLFMAGVQQGQLADLQIQVRDPQGYYITDGFVPLWLYAWGAGSTPDDGGSGRAKVFEPELYSPAGGMLLLDFFNPGSTVISLPLFANAPVVIDPVRPTQNEFTQGVGGSGQDDHVIGFGGKLYMVLHYNQAPFPATSLNVYRSSDGGLTWTLLDGANAPSIANTGESTGGVLFDGAHTITVACSTGSVIHASPQPITLKTFDLTTETWGATFAPGSPNVYLTNQVYVRSDGTYLVIAVDSIAGGVASSTTAYVWNGAAWSSFPITTGTLPGGWVPSCNSATVYDPNSSLIHLFGSAHAGAVKHTYYLQLTLGNTVANFQDTTGLYALPTSPGNPLVIGSNLVYGVADITSSFATILIGAPLSNPVFTIAPSPGINPAQPIPGFPNTLQPVLRSDGTFLYAVFINSAAEVQIWFSLTANLSNPATGWIGGLIFDDLPLLFAGAQYPTLAIVNGFPMITFGAFLSTAPGPPFAFSEFFLAATSVGLPVQVPPPMEFRGIKRFVECS